jgi:hypothetical protein
MKKKTKMKIKTTAVITACALALIGCATQPTAVDRENADHMTMVAKIGAIKDPAERARVLRIENYRHMKSLEWIGDMMVARARSAPRTVYVEQQPQQPTYGAPSVYNPFGAPGSTAFNPVYVAPVPQMPPAPTFR